MARPIGSKNKVQESSDVNQVKPEEVIAVEEKKASVPINLKDKVFFEDGRYRLKDDNEALCNTCFHRQDMHHVWREVEKSGVERDVYGVKRDVTWIQKFKKFDVPTLPCQHACKCENFK